MSYRIVYLPAHAAKELSIEYPAKEIAIEKPCEFWNPRRELDGILRQLERALTQGTVVTL